MILYSIRTSGQGYMIAKFSKDMNVEAVYTLRHDGRYLSCDCPAGPRPSCKHRRMLPTFAQAGAIDSDQFLCYETQTWHQPIATFDEGDPLAAKAADAAKAPLTSQQVEDEDNAAEREFRPTRPTPPSPTRIRRI